MAVTIPNVKIAEDFEYRGIAFGNHALRNKDVNELEEHYEGNARTLIAVVDIERERANRIIFNLRHKVDVMRAALKAQSAECDDAVKKAAVAELDLVRLRSMVETLGGQVAHLRNLQNDNARTIDKLERAATNKKPRRR
jgi:Holliday junction resolvasome RuvABC DNA-binding subunit